MFWNTHGLRTLVSQHVKFNINIWCFEIYPLNNLCSLGNKFNINIWCFEIMLARISLSSHITFNINIWCFEITSRCNPFIRLFRLISTYDVLKFWCVNSLRSLINCLIPTYGVLKLSWGEYWLCNREVFNTNIWCFEINNQQSVFVYKDRFNTNIWCFEIYL